MIHPWLWRQISLLQCFQRRLDLRKHYSLRAPSRRASPSFVPTVGQFIEIHLFVE